jgi:threonine/homoserine/homoserine lactone efflux protein
MAPEGYLLLALFALVSTITPGGATTLAMASGAHFGFRRSVPLMAGIALGLTAMAAAAGAGLAGLLLAAPSLQFALRVIGSVYLMWLAWQIASSGSPRRGTNVTRRAGFVGGAWVLCLNPKAWAMTLSAAASFIALASGPLQLALLLGLTFGTAAAVSLSLWCMGGLLLARTLRTDRQWRMLNLALGLLLAAPVIPMWLE